MQSWCGGEPSCVLDSALRPALFVDGEKTIWWDGGPNEHGQHIDMKHTRRPTLGCRVPTTACQNGWAVASKIHSIWNEEAHDGCLIVKWSYSCELRGLGPGPSEQHHHQHHHQLLQQQQRQQEQRRPETDCPNDFVSSAQLPQLSATQLVVLSLHRALELDVRMRMRARVWVGGCAVRGGCI